MKTNQIIEKKVLNITSILGESATNITNVRFSNALNLIQVNYDIESGLDAIIYLNTVDNAIKIINCEAPLIVNDNRSILHCKTILSILEISEYNKKILIQSINEIKELTNKND